MSRSTATCGTQNAHFSHLSQSIVSATISRVAWIIDYQQVLDRTRELGLRCVYYNSGAFAHEDASDVRIVGWLGPPDPTIRVDLPATLISLPEPYAENLADKLLTIWPARIDGPAWLLPKSHWSFELDHGNRSWLPTALDQIGIDPGHLLERPNAAAVQFEPDESDKLRRIVIELLNHLETSDFAILFPRQQHLLTIHHHKQLWWQTKNADFAKILV